MRRPALLVTVALYCAILVAPVAIHAAGVRHKLRGALPPDKRPALTVDAVLDERFQRGFTRWFENHRTLFGLPVYADNTALYRVFGETRFGARVVLGREAPYLFVDEDLGHLNLREYNLPTPEAVDALAARLARLQATLRARGTSLVPVIAPAKTSVFPDQIDPRWRRFDGEPPSDRAVYRPLVAALGRHGVRFVDMRAELTSGRHDRAAIWAPEARHWSYYAACLAWQGVLAHHAALQGGAPSAYPCVLGHEPATRMHAQFDLWRLLNVWTVPRSSDRAPVAVHAPPADGAPRVRALYVGTSFGFEMLEDAGRSGRFDDPQFLYYDSTLISRPVHVTAPMSALDPAWPALVARKDLIVLDLMEAAVFSGHPYLTRFLDGTEDDR